MSTPAVPSCPPPTPLLTGECALLATLLRRAIANSQLALHGQDLDEAGRETEEGPSIVAQDWAIDPDLVTYSDGAAARPGVHVYVAVEDLEALLGMEESA